jgi:integrase
MTRKVQTGMLIKQGESVYIRWYDEQKRRVAKVLCRIDHKHYQTVDKKGRVRWSKPVEILRQRHMLTVNTAPSNERTTVADFWENQYLPYIEKFLKPSSVNGYKKVWNGLLKDHFGGRTLAEYRTGDGVRLLESLASRMTKTSIHHVRSLCSAIFSRACQMDLLPSNPWREVKTPHKAKDPRPTQHYSLEEFRSCMEKLTDVRARTVFGLSFMLGTRPGELSALRWEDFAEGHVTVRRSAWRGHVTQTKTGTEKKVVVIPQAKELVEQWRLASGGPTVGFLFPSRDGCLDLSQYANRVLKPMLGKSYKPLYSSRRGLGTALTELTGDALAARGQLRHSSIGTTQNFYVKDMPDETKRGMDELSRKIGEKTPK